ncbi:hypothetical protein [Nocardioides sp. KR10-350]|uniref:hypothetical protein n=1 Tax=Nocardioides cheoyonin TaxID=3156615 RepID=UPI0032B5D46D
MQSHVVPLALSHADRTAWWVAIVVGFVVVLAVAGLLTVLVLEVRTIERRVTAVRDTLAQAKANTADTALIGRTAAGVEAVLAEGLQHHLFLGRVLGKVRS